MVEIYPPNLGVGVSETPCFTVFFEGRPLSLGGESSPLKLIKGAWAYRVLRVDEKSPPQPHRRAHDFGVHSVPVQSNVCFTGVAIISPPSGRNLQGWGWRYPSIPGGEPNPGRALPSGTPPGAQTLLA